MPATTTCLHRRLARAPPAACARSSRARRSPSAPESLSWCSSSRGVYSGLTLTTVKPARSTATIATGYCSTLGIMIATRSPARQAAGPADRRPSARTVDRVRQSSRTCSRRASASTPSARPMSAWARPSPSARSTRCPRRWRPGCRAAACSKGARVAIMMPNVLQYPVAVAAVLRAGFIVVNVNPLYTRARARASAQRFGRRGHRSCWRTSPARWQQAIGRHAGASTWSSPRWATCWASPRA